MSLTWISLLLIMTQTFSVWALCLGPGCVTLMRLHYGTWVQVVLDCTMEPHVFVEMFLGDFRFFYWPLRGCTGDLGKSRPLKTIPQCNWKQPQNGRQQSHCLPPPLSQLSIWATVQSPYIFVFVCKHNSQELMIGANYLKHVLQFYLTT